MVCRNASASRIEREVVGQAADEATDRFGIIGRSATDFHLS
jgi:hypothetical protein